MDHKISRSYKSLIQTPPSMTQGNWNGAPPFPQLFHDFPYSAFSLIDYYGYGLNVVKADIPRIGGAAPA